MAGRKKGVKAIRTVVRQGEKRECRKELERNKDRWKEERKVNKEIKEKVGGK